MPDQPPRRKVLFVEGEQALVASYERYFDTRSKAVAAVAGTLKQLGSGGAGVSLPTIGESLAAVRGYKASRERAGR